jgi:Xaa-Pro aminopeptidase
MHAAVVAAKAAGTAATREGSNAQAVHQATIDAIQQHGYQVGLPGEEESDDYCAMTHGTGHGIGLEVHEPPLLDFGGPDLIRGDALTIEPGLYRRSLGGVRVEDMVIVTADGCLNLNQLPEGLDWSL